MACEGGLVLTLRMCMRARRECVAVCERGLVRTSSMCVRALCSDVECLNRTSLFNFLVGETQVLPSLPHNQAAHTHTQNQTTHTLSLSNHTHETPTLSTVQSTTKPNTPKPSPLRTLLQRVLCFHSLSKQKQTSLVPLQLGVPPLRGTASKNPESGLTGRSNGGLQARDFRVIEVLNPSTPDPRP
eukprot:2651236-Rhodomonas_salina.1